jgi:hypothetical protein
MRILKGLNISEFCSFFIDHFVCKYEKDFFPILVLRELGLLIFLSCHILFQSKFQAHMCYFYFRSSYILKSRLLRWLIDISRLSHVY